MEQAAWIVESFREAEQLMKKGLEPLPGSVQLLQCLYREVIQEPYREKVYTVAEKVGYANVNYFHSKFKKYVGESPTAYRKHRNAMDEEKMSN